LETAAFGLQGSESMAVGSLRGGMIMRQSIVLLGVVLVLALGCAREGAREGVVLTVWETYNTEERPVFLGLIQEFQKANPGITVEAVNVPFDGMEPKILTALATETAPDIGRVDVAFLPKLAVRRALHNLDEYGVDEIVDQIRPVAMSSCIVDGRTYGLPDQVNGLCLFYNKELFRDAGLDPEKPPRTWDEFVAYAKVLTDKQKGVFGFGMKNSLWWSLPFIYSFGGDILSDDMTRCALADEGAMAGFQFKVDLYRKHAIEGGAWRSGGIRDDVGFQSRKYAMIFNGPWAVKGLERSGIDFGVSVIPSGPAGQATNVGGNNMVVFGTSKHPEEACKLLMFIASKESQTKWANELGQIPVNTLADGMVDFGPHPYLRVFMEQMKYAKPRPQIGSYPEIENDVNPEMQAALDDKKSVAEAMKSACEEVNKILADEEALKASFSE
jgi:ABC-type glycerol-3-phosphate transport system substrate-binding protein